MCLCELVSHLAGCERSALKVMIVRGREELLRPRYNYSEVLFMSSIMHKFGRRVYFFLWWSEQV